MRLEINGIEDAFTKYDQEEFKGVRVHFSINENGIFSCASAEAVFEKVSTEKSTLDSILGYFSSTPEAEDKTEPKADTPGNTNTSDNATVPPDSGNITMKADSNKSTKPEVLMSPLEIIMTYLDYPDPPEESISASKQKLLILALKDEEKRLLEMAQNNLEAFIYDLKERLFREEVSHLYLIHWYSGNNSLSIFNRQLQLQMRNNASQWLLKLQRHPSGSLSREATR